MAFLRVGGPVLLFFGSPFVSAMGIPTISDPGALIGSIAERAEYHSSYLMYSSQVGLARQELVLLVCLHCEIKGDFTPHCKHSELDPFLSQTVAPLIGQFIADQAFLMRSSIQAASFPLARYVAYTSKADLRLLDLLGEFLANFGKRQDHELRSRRRNDSHQCRSV